MKSECRDWWVKEQKVLLYNLIGHQWQYSFLCIFHPILIYIQSGIYRTCVSCLRILLIQHNDATFALKLPHFACRRHRKFVATVNRILEILYEPPQSRPARAGWHFCWWCCSIPSALTRLTNSHAIIYREVPERRRQLELTRLDSPVSPWMNEWMTGRAIECAKEMLDGRGMAGGLMADGWQGGDVTRSTFWAI